MSIDNDKKLDVFLKELMKDIPLEKPHDDFTDGVLRTVKMVASKNSRAVYTPVFSKVSWMVVGAIAVSLLIMGFLYGEQGTVIPDFLSFLPDRSKLVFSVKLPTIAGSRILLFSSMALIGCVAVQIVWLKKSWAKKQVLF